MPRQCHVSPLSAVTNANTFEPLAAMTQGKKRSLAQRGTLDSEPGQANPQWVGDFCPTTEPIQTNSECQVRR